MKPVKDLVDLVVLILTQTIDGSRLEVVSTRTAPSSRSGSTSFGETVYKLPSFVRTTPPAGVSECDSICFPM